MELKEKFIRELLKIKGSHRFETSRKELLGFWFEGIEGEALALLLQSEGVKASTESPCLKKYTKDTKLSHEQAHASVTIAWNNRFTEDEVKTILKSLKKNIKKLRKISATWVEK